MSMPRYTCVESAVRISVPRVFATWIATRLFPMAVGPTRNTTGSPFERTSAETSVLLMPQALLSIIMPSQASEDAVELLDR